MKLVNISGEVFGRLSALNYLKNGFWLCLCSCGKESAVRGKDLRTGNTKSCGCLAKEKLVDKRKLAQQVNTLDLTGQKFERLTALDSPKPNKWHCLCDCGAEVIISTGSLRSGNSLKVCFTVLRGLTSCHFSRRNPLKLFHGVP
jgi:hypothetical protein